MNEIPAYEPGLSLIPLSHCSGTAHRQKSIEEAATCLQGHPLLDCHQLRDSRHGADFSACFPGSPIHRAHHQDRSLRERRPNTADHFLQLLPVGLNHERSITAFVRTIVNYNEVRLQMSQRLAPM